MAGTRSLPGFEHLVEAMHAGGGLLADAPPFLDDCVNQRGASLAHALEQILDDLLLVAAAGRC